MMKSAVRTLAAFAAAAAFAVPAWAQDADDELAAESEAETSEAEASEAAEGEESGAEVSSRGEGAAKSAEGRNFTSLPFCRRLEGSAEVLKPGAAGWVAIEEGVFYPLGSSFRTTDDASKLVIQFGNEVQVSLDSAASFGTRMQALGETVRTVLLQGGVISVSLPRNFPQGVFSIVAPGFKVVNPAGESRYAYVRTADGEAAQIRCVTGRLKVEGRHFTFPELKAADEIKIRTSQDLLFTGLYGNRGDCMVLLDQGLKKVKNYATGETTIENKPLEWPLSPRTAVRIHRALPAIGERMSVTVMTFDAAGALKNRCAFAEGREDVNSGELGPTAKRDREELAKRAAEATETVAVEAEPEEESSSDDAADSGDAGGDSGDSGDDDLGF